MRKRLFLGDSNFARWDLSYYFANAVNGGVPGDTSGMAYSRLGSLLYPDLTEVIVMLGTNDVYNIAGATPNSYIPLIGQAIDNNTDAKVLLCKIPPSGWWPSSGYQYNNSPAGNAAIRDWNAGVEQIAADHDWRVVDFHSIFVNNDGSLKTELYNADLVHIDPPGNRQMAIALRPFL